MRRYEKQYKIKDRDNLGDAGFWNGRFEDIDLRLAALEGGLADVAAIGARVEALALDRINNVVTPLVVETIERVAQIPELFRATSATAAAIGTGGMQFVIDEGQRMTFAAMSWVRIVPLDNLDFGMTAEVVSLNRDTGVLVVDVAQSYGTGTFSAWTIYVAAPPNLQHETRLDNPHATTAAQVGAYTKAEVDGKITTVNTALSTKAALDSATLTGTPTAPTPPAGNNSTRLSTTAFVTNAINALLGGAGPALDTLSELAAALGNDANFATTTANALALRVRADAAQTFNSTQKTQARGNIDAAALAHTHAIADVTNLQNSLDAKGNLSGANFASLQAAGRQVYGTQTIAAVGGDESDLALGGTDRLYVDFTATGASLIAIATLSIQNSSSSNDAILDFRLINLNGYVDVAAYTVGETCPDGFGFAAAFAATLSGYITVGQTYRLMMTLRKTQNVGPVNPRNMRISAINS